MTYILIFITAIVSIAAFNNRQLFDRLAFVPDLVRRRNDPQYASIGASGAVSAVIFTSIFFNPWSKIYFFGILPIPGILFGILYVGYEQYMSRRPGDHINHNAHLFGALFGFVFPLLMEPSLWHVFVKNLTSF